MKCKECKDYYCQYRTTNAEKDCYYEQQNTKQFDWQSFRAEAAKDILCAVLPSIQIIDGYFSKPLSNAISNSINAAEELIKQLKEKEANE